ACLLLAPAVAGATHLALLVETDTNCDGSVSLPPFTLLRGSIRAYPDAGGFRAANFAIEVPPTFFTTYTPSGAVASASGDTFGPGASVSLQDCQTDPNGVKLYDVTLFNLSLIQGAFFTFRPLSGSGMTCPTTSGCDLVPHCVTGSVWPISEPPILQSPP